ncbi:MAG: stage II sporulation protein M [Acidobacteriota bacterium]|nr:stage II sporulation protein M [Acidobacteriota bacterium]
MDYAAFQRLRQPVWEGFEQALESARRQSRPSHQEVEALAMSYRQVLHDHALATSRYPGTGAARRLRRLAAAGTHYLHREPPAKSSGGSFFLYTFPNAVWRRSRALGIALGVFVLLAVFGLAVTIYRPGLGVAFVGTEAVEGMRHGRLWTESLTTTTPPAISSSFIATNNLSVALTAWAGGALAGIGSLFILALNGLMLGSVIGITLHYSMDAALFEFIAAHGPLELTIIIVSAGAGLVLAHGLVTAQDRPRGEVLRESARDALVILAGCLPWLVLLALVEVFVSPDPQVPVVFKLALGLALEAAFLGLAFNPLATGSPTSTGPGIEAPHPTGSPHG